MPHDTRRLRSTAAQLEGEFSAARQIWLQNLNLLAPNTTDPLLTTSPRRTKFNRDQRGRQGKALDTTGVRTTTRLKGAISSFVIPRGQEWVAYEVPRRLRNDFITRDNLEIHTGRLYDALVSSDFYSEQDAALDMSILLGNGILQTLESTPLLQGDGSTFTGFDFESVPPWDCVWRVGPKGKISFFRRQWSMSADEAFRFFNGRPGARVMQMLMRGTSAAEDNVVYNQYIYPNPDHIPGGPRISENMPWLSHWTHEDDEETVRVSGFMECPVTLFFWEKPTGQNTGRGIGHIARPLAAVLSSIRVKSLAALSWDMRPPWLQTEENSIPMQWGRNRTITLRDPEGFVPRPLHTESRYDAALEFGRQERDEMEKITMSEFFESPDSQVRNATESLRLQRISAALLSNFGNSFEKAVKPTIRRCTEIMRRNNAAPEYEEALDRMGQEDAQILLVGPLYQAQRAQAILQVEALSTILADLVAKTQDPSYMDILDPAGVGEVIAEHSQVPSRALRTPELVDQVQRSRGARVAEERVRANVTALREAGISVQ